LPDRENLAKTTSIEKFTYVPEENCYLCPAGKPLNYVGINKRNRVHGNVSLPTESHEPGFALAVTKPMYFSEMGSMYLKSPSGRRSTTPHEAELRDIDHENQESRAKREDRVVCCSP
jgi:hypothetical protein